MRQRLAAVKKRLTQADIVMNDSKSVNKPTSLSWLGYEISKDGLKPAREKAERIRKLEAPRSMKEVRQLLGIVNYYSRYIPSMATIAEPLHDLLRKNRKFRWGQREQQSLYKIKSEICRSETLAYFDTSSKVKTYLTTDASEEGLGAVLEQEQADGIIKPVTYWSSKLRKYEKNYSISEKEALAAVSAMNKFRKYLLGRKFTLRTDHRALTALLSQKCGKSSSARTERL